MASGLRSPNLRVTRGFLDLVNDQYPGGGSATPGLTPGMVGEKVTLGIGDCKLSSSFSNPHSATVTPHGTFQYVQTLSTDTLQSRQGIGAFWSNRETYLVTTSDTNKASVAGVFIGAITPGYYGFIQVPKEGGVAIVRAADGGTIFAAQKPVFAAANGTGQFDCVAIASVTAVQVQSQIGIALTAADGTTGLAAVALGGQLS